MKTQHILNIALTIAFTSFGAHASTTLLNDSFTDNNRTNQSLPDSAAYYLLGRSSGNLAASGGQLNWTTGTTSTTVAYFTDSGAITLATGEYISLGFTFQVTGATDLDQGLRLGLFNSGGTRISGDNAGSASSPMFSDDTGYFASLNLSNTSAAKFGIYDRSSSTAQNLFDLGTGTTALGFTTGVILADGTPYNGNVTLLNTGSGVQVTITIAGVTITRTDTTSPNVAFDMLAFYNSNAATSGISFSNISVTVVPEPRIAAMLALGALLMGLRRKPKTNR